MRKGTLAVLLSAPLLLLTSGCGIDPGHEAEREFVEHFTTAYPDHVVDTRTAAADKLPWIGGDMAGALVLADDTPPEVFADILADLTTWQPGSGSNYEPVGLVANGVGVCLADEQQEQLQALRDALYAEGLALEGSWPCPEALYGRDSSYQGTLDQVARDAAVVRELWDGPGDLRLRAAVSDLSGTIDHSWPGLPDTLGATLEVVDAQQQVVAWTLTDDGLRIAITPTVDPGPTQVAATAAAGPDLTVQLMQGSLDADRAASLADLAHVADALRPVEGVTSVTVNDTGVVVATPDPGAVRRIYDAALEHGEFEEDLALRIRVDLPGAGGTTQNYFVRTPGGDDELLPLFDDLLASEVVTRVWVSSPLPVHDPDTPQPGVPTIPGVRLSLAGPVVDTVPALRGILPDGLRLSLTGPDHRDSVDLTTAPTIAAEDLRTIFTVPDLEAIAAAWNAAG